MELFQCLRLSVAFEYDGLTCLKLDIIVICSFFKKIPTILGNPVRNTCYNFDFRFYKCCYFSNKIIISLMREIRHDLIPANAIDSHEPEPLKLHDLIHFLLNTALTDAYVFPIRR